MVKKLLIKDLLNNVPIKDALRICRKKVGSTHDIDEEESQIMIDFIRKRYGSIFCSDIIEAFDMAIDGRFEYINPRDLAPLKTRFTQAFLSQIMNPYLSYRAEKNRSLQRKEQIETPEKPFDWGKFLKMYEQAKEGVYDFKELEWLYFEKLEEMGIELITIEEKKRIFKEVKDQVTRKAKDTEDAWIWRVKKECRAIVFKDWIMENALNDIDLKQKLGI